MNLKENQFQGCEPHNSLFEQAVRKLPLPVCAAWALGAAWMARRVNTLQQRMHWLDRVAGAMFIGFGLQLALTDQPAA